jgi:hypothetical protein
MSGVQQQQDNNKDAKKSPGEVAAGKLKEALAKEVNSKVEAQLKVVVDAYEVFLKEKEKFDELQAEATQNKLNLAEILSELV